MPSVSFRKARPRMGARQGAGARPGGPIRRVRREGRSKSGACPPPRGRPAGKLPGTRDSQKASPPRARRSGAGMDCSFLQSGLSVHENRAGPAGAREPPSGGKPAPVPCPDKPDFRPSGGPRFPNSLKAPFPTRSGGSPKNPITHVPKGEPLGAGRPKKARKTDPSGTWAFGLFSVFFRASGARHGKARKKLEKSWKKPEKTPEKGGGRIPPAPAEAASAKARANGSPRAPGDDFPAFRTSRPAAGGACARAARRSAVPSFQPALINLQPFAASRGA